MYSKIWDTIGSLPSPCSDVLKVILNRVALKVNIDGNIGYEFIEIIHICHPYILHREFKTIIMGDGEKIETIRYNTSPVDENFVCKKCEYKFSKKEINHIKLAILGIKR